MASLLKMPSLNSNLSTYVLMKILESAPSRYDAGIRILTLGKLDQIYDDLVSHIEKGQKVLDIGCGTGALTLRAAERGAHVKGIDINPQMLEIGRNRAAEANFEDYVEFCEMGIAELVEEESGIYDVVMSGLCFSELSEDETVFTLHEVMRILKPGTLLLIADEVRPNNLGKRILNWIVRVPLVVVTYLLTQTTTRAVVNLPDRVYRSGFQLRSVQYSRLGNFLWLEARKPEKTG